MKVSLFYLLIIIVFSLISIQGFNGEDIEYYVYEVEENDYHLFNLTLTEPIHDGFNLWKNGTLKVDVINRVDRIYEKERPDVLFKVFLDLVEFEYISDDDLYFSMIQPIIVHNATGDFQWIGIVDERSDCEVDYFTIPDPSAKLSSLGFTYAEVDCRYNGNDEEFRFISCIDNGVVLEAIWNLPSENFTMKFEAWSSNYKDKTILWQENRIIQINNDEEIGSTEINFKINYPESYFLGLVLMPILVRLKWRR